MSEPELVELFGTIAPTLRATIRAVYKSGVRESRLPEGALLRTEVQGAENGQGDAGIPHQAVRLPRPVPSHRHELQSSSEGVALPFLGEEGDGFALPVGEMYHRPCEAEPGDCGAFKGYEGGMGTTK